MKPLPLAKTVIGYCDELSRAPGETISFFVHGEDVASDYEVEILRLHGGGQEPSAPALDARPVEALGRFRLLQQVTLPGSWGEASPAANTVEALVGEGTAVLWVQPMWPGTRQVLVDLAQGTVQLLLDDSGCPVLEHGGTRISLDSPLTNRQWHVVVAAWGPSGTTLSVRGVKADAAAWNSTHGSTATAGQNRLAPRVRIAAADDGAGHVDHFRGRIERPTLFESVLDPTQAVAAAHGGSVPPVLAWDFTRDIETWSVPGHGTDDAGLTLYGAPKRAVRGHRWCGTATDWRESREEYGAIQFYSDSLEDCDWQPQATWTVPAGTASGFYAARVTTRNDLDHIPFFIRPTADASPAPVLVVASSATYAAYANSRFWWEDPIQEVAQDRLVELGAEEQYLVTHPELGLSNYDMHGDETPVAFSSRRRPNLFMRPGHSRNESYAGDLYLLSWLERLGLDYDVVTDEDLHFAGRDILDRYRVALSGSHPEYISIAMFDAMKSWVEDGGRYLYLGGNGFTSNVTWGAERPWLMENRTTGRKRGEEIASLTEARHQLDGSLGRGMEESGRSTGSLFGVDSVTMGFDRSYPVARTEVSRASEFAFAFEGIEGTLFGGRSLSGSGVIGQEWDNARRMRGTPRHYVLAHSVDHSLIPSVLGADAEHQGDVVMFFHGRGVVFSASSMAWVGALHIGDYDNDAERFTRNVLLRFLDPESLPDPDTTEA